LCSDSTLLSRHGEALHLISRIVRDAAATIGRLQDFARRGQSQQLQNVDLNAIISQSVEIAKSTLEERNLLLGKSLRVDVDVPRLPPIVAEPAELRQIFLNLLLNAQDAMPSGGTIRIAGHAQNGKIVVIVEDEGHGIEEAILGRVFDPFFSTKGTNGTGLGLSIARASMVRIGGTIAARNRLQRGAVFTLCFPVGPANLLHDGPQHSLKVKPCRVMLIDDDLDNLQALGALLEWKGHEVIRTRSGIEALEKLGSSSVDMVFCDLGMSQVNGWEVARQLKSREDPPAFYLLTGWAAEIPTDDPRRGLIDGIVSKPVDPGILDGLLARRNSERIDSRESNGAGGHLNGSGHHHE
jgi:CheY-like chemotaxis protein